MALAAGLALAPGEALAAPNADQRLARGAELTRQGRYVAALSALRLISKVGLTPAQAASLDLALAMNLTEAGEYEKGLVAARAAVASTKSAFGGKSEPHFRSLLVLARVSGLGGGPGPEAVDALAAARNVAPSLSGANGPHAIEVLDRITLMLSATAPEEALRQNDAALAEADRISGIDPALLLRLVSTRGVILLRARRYDDAVRALDLARKGRSDLLGTEHPDTLVSQHNYARALEYTGKSADAETLLSQVLAQRSRVLGPGHPDTLVTQKTLATLRLERGDAQGLLDLRAVAAATAKRYGSGHPVTLDAKAALAAGMEGLGDTDGALALARATYNEAVKVRGLTDPTTLNIGHQFGAILQKAGRPAPALAVLNDVLVGTRLGANDKHPDVLATLTAIAAIQQDLGRPDVACPLLERVFADMPQGGVRNTLNRLTVQNNLAVCWWSLGRRREAVEAMQLVAGERERLLGADAPLALSSRSSEAAWLSEQGRHEAAITLQTRIFAVRSAADPQSAATLSSLHNLAAALDAAGRDEEALRRYREVVAARDRRLGPLHPDTITSRRMLAGRLLESGDLTAARAVYAQAAEAVEASRADGALTDSDRRSYFATVADIHKVAALLALRDGDSAAAIGAAERARARTLLEMTSQRGATRALLSESDARELARLGRLVAELDLAPPQPDPVAQAARAAARASAARRLAVLEAGAARRSRAYSAATRPRILGAAQLLKALPSDAAYIEFVTLGDRLLVLWLAGGRSGGRDLGTAPHLADTVEAYRAVMADPRGLEGLRNPPIGLARRRVWAMPGGGFQLRGASDPPDSEDAQLVTDVAPMRAALSAAVLKGLPPEVLARRRWVISPDGPLGLLAFETLEFEDRPLVASREVSYTASLSTLALLQERRGVYARLRRTPMLALGDPAYPEGDAALPRLPASRAELTALQQIYGLKEGADLISGAAATRPALLQLAVRGRLRDVRFLVISAHGVLDADAPDRSAVALSPTVDPRDDGYLRAAELMALDLRTDLVVLSACETGAGRWRNGEGVLGLPYALIVAGSNATLLTQWSIPDESAAEFTRRFFEKVKGGRDFAGALADTKREFADGAVRSEWRAPAHWAAFVLYGG